MSTKRIKAVINKAAIISNIKNLYNHMDNPVPILCVIKANGYGHGAIELAKIYEQMDEVCGYATATPEEALALREAGLNKMILILGAVFKEDYETLILNNVSMTVFTKKAAKEISEIATKLNKIANVHIKVDTGMSRIGIPANDEGFEIIKSISKLDNICLEGLFTHFARADEINKDNALNQLNKYNYISNRVKEEKINIKIRHCSNSAALLEIPDARFDMVRAGIVLYGLWPSDEVCKENIELVPVMSLISHVVYVKTIEAGTSISYGGTFVAQKSMKIATIPVGYADGYPRTLSGKAYVLINGKKASILGRVCMDQMMVDVSEIPDIKEGDRVVLLGNDGDESITAEELGNISGRFNYEFVCDITARVPRVME